MIGRIGTRFAGEGSCIKILFLRTNFDSLDFFCDRGSKNSRRQRPIAKDEEKKTQSHSTQKTHSSTAVVMWLCWSLVIVLLAAVTQLLSLFLSHPNNPRLVPSEGIIVVSSSTGGGRELALNLADAGFQVIVGVSSNQERKSYKYSSNKGLDQRDNSSILM
jgi:hypothetical protein